MVRPPSQSSLTASASWVLLGRVLSFLFAFALPLLLVRRLDQSNFGLYKQVFLFVSTAVMLLPLGFHMSAFYFLPRERERQHQVVFNILLFHAFVASGVGVAVAVWPGLLKTIFNSEEMTGFATRIALVILTWVVSSTLEYIAIANHEYKLSTIVTTAGNLTRSIFFLGAAIWFGSVGSLINAGIIHGVIQVATLLVYLNMRFPGFWRTFRWSMMREQLSYALPFGFASVLLWTQTDMHNYFVAHHFGPAEYAIYAVGCFQIPLVIILNESVGFVMVSHVSHLQKLGNTREIIELTARMIRKLALPCFPLYVSLLVLGREFILTLFTSRYLASWKVFVIFLTMVPLSIAVNVYDPIIRAYAEHRYFLLKLRAVLFVGLFLALLFSTSSVGLSGVIAMVVIVSFLERLVMILKVSAILGVKWRDLTLLKDVGKLAIAAIVAGFVAAIIRLFLLEFRPITILALCGVIFYVVYVGVALLLGVLTTGERNLLKTKLIGIQQQVFGKRTAEPMEQG